MTRKREIKGFTLIELMVVMAIIAVLATIIIGAITVARNTTKETTNRSNATILRTGLEQYYSRYRAYCGKDAATPNVKCATTYTFANLETQLNLAGVTVTLNPTDSFTGGGKLVTAQDGATLGTLTASTAYLAPFASNDTDGTKVLPTVNLP